MPKKIYVVTLDAEERSYLQEIVSKGKASAHKRLHAQILLKADGGPQGPGWKDQQIIEAFEVNHNTVERVRQRFVEEGVEAALNRKKRAVKKLPKIDGEAEARLIAEACGDPPPGFSRWTLRLLAGRLVELELVESVSHETVRKALKKTSLSPG
jgi:transposase